MPLLLSLNARLFKLNLFGDLKSRELLSGELFIDKIQSLHSFSPLNSYQYKKCVLLKLKLKTRLFS